jgi:DNA polymerase III gamma/tau subunit
MTIIESNGLFNYITKEKIKKLLDTKPDSEVRKCVTEEIVKELTSKEELEEVSDITSDLTESEVSYIINDENTDSTEEEKTSDNTDIREKELKSLDNIAITASLDDERVQFLVSDFVNNLWYDILNNKLDVRKIEDIHLNTELPNKIKEQFINEYNEVINLLLPKTWNYKHKPLLMQKLISYRLAQRKHYGNWSGVGAGKTIGAILAGRYVGAKNTLIITFNSTIGKEDERGWTKEIRDSFKDSKIYTKISKNVKFDNKYHNYLVLNYETFQQKGSANYVIDLFERNKFDYVILDEVQSIKQTTINDESKRREVIFGLVGKVRELNPDYYLLAMSATPVINNLVEAKSLKGESLVNYQDLNLLGHKETPIDIITKVEAYQEGNEHIFSDIIGEKERTQGYVELYDLQIKYNHSYIANGNMIHNCHQLLSATQEALLKALEEPPEHVHFIMCTTNPEALKTTFKRRCHIYELSPLNSSQLMNHLKKILNAEKVENYPTTILDKIIELSDGSAGIALKYLDMVIDMKNDIDRAMETLKSSGTSETEIIDICRTLMNFQISNLSRWTRVKHLLSNFKGDAESARRPILGYFEKCLLGKSSNEMEIILMADEFKDNFYDNGKYGLTAACFKACYSPEEK